jgi:hypothetical protein
MAILRVKRGTTKPSTANLAYVGELAFDYTNNALYARNSTSVVKVGGEQELVYSIETASSSISVSYAFNSAYIYTIVVIATTYGSTVDTSSTTINYRTSGLSNISGSALATYANDVVSGVTKMFNGSSTSLAIPDSYSSGITLASGISKTITFQLTPIFSTGFTDIRQWLSTGRSVTTVTGQANASVTMTEFAHSIGGVPQNLLINPGLDLGSPDLISVSIYRTARK